MTTFFLVYSVDLLRSKVNLSQRIANSYKFSVNFSDYERKSTTFDQSVLTSIARIPPPPAPSWKFIYFATCLQNVHKEKSFRIVNEEKFYFNSCFIRRSNSREIQTLITSWPPVRPFFHDTSRRLSVYRKEIGLSITIQRRILRAFPPYFSLAKAIYA
jgi:hypothetical protein